MDWKALVAARARAAGSPSPILAFGRRVKGPRGVSGQGGRRCSSKRARARSCSGRSPRQPVRRGGGEPTWAGKERGHPICAAKCAPMQRAALPTAVGPWGQQTGGSGAGQERGPPIRSAAHGPMLQPPSQLLTASKGTADGGGRGRSGAKAAHFFRTAVGHRAESEIHAGGGTEVDCWSAGSVGRLAARRAVRHSVASSAFYCQLGEDT